MPTALFIGGPLDGKYRAISRAIPIVEIVLYTDTDHLRVLPPPSANLLVDDDIFLYYQSHIQHGDVICYTPNFEESPLPALLKFYAEFRTCAKKIQGSLQSFFEATSRQD